MMKIADYLSTFIVVTIALSPGICKGQSFGLDNTFGDGGIVTSPYAGDGDCGFSVAIQNDGKILLGGKTSSSNGNDDMALLRYNSNGALDFTFGTMGMVTTHFSDYTDRIMKIFELPDGKILSAGSSYVAGTGQDFALIRYNSDGSYDDTFGTNGKATVLVVQGDDLCFDAHVSNTGKIIVAGRSTETSGVTWDFSLACFNPDGSLDTTFASDGTVKSDLSSYDLGWMISVQDDGKIVMGGTIYDLGYRAGLTRYNADGSTDNTFGINGKVTGVAGFFRGIGLLSNGNIVMAGSSGHSDSSSIVITCYKPDGTLDSTFGTNGVVYSLSDGGRNYAEDMIILQDDKILICGSDLGEGGNGKSSLLLRFNSNGSPDSTFSQNGVIRTYHGGGSSMLDLISLALQEDGKIVVGGTLIRGGAYDDYDFLLMRYSNTLTGINTGVEKNLKTELYPNPSSGSFILQINDPGFTAGELLIYTVSGQLACKHYLARLPGNTRHYSINLSLPVGIYVYRVSNETEMMDEGKLLIH